MTELHVEEVEGRDPPVVLLHHGANSLRGWDPFVPGIAGGRRLIAYDRRGFGRSPRDAVFDAGLFDRDADDLAELLRERDAAPAHLVGFSDGATVALITAVRHPELVVSVTSIGNHIRLDRATHRFLLDRGSEPAPSGTPSTASGTERIGSRCSATGMNSGRGSWSTGTSRRS